MLRIYHNNNLIKSYICIRILGKMILAVLLQIEITGFFIFSNREKEKQKL